MGNNMKKFIPIIVVGILVLSGLGAAAFTTNVSIKQATIVKNESTSVLFSSQPTQLEKDGFGSNNCVVAPFISISTNPSFSSCVGCDEKRTDVDSFFTIVACFIETFVVNAAAPSPLRTKIPTTMIGMNFFIFSLCTL